MKNKIFSNYLTIKVKGFNQAKVLSVLKEEGVTVWNVLRTDASHMSLTLSQKHSKKTFAILEKMCYTYQVECMQGVVNSFKWWLGRIGLIVGAALFAAVTVFAQSFVWTIEVIGNDKVSVTEIEQRLQDEGIYRGAFKSNVNNREASDAVRDMERIAEASVQLKGTNVIVRVLESTDYVPPEISDPADIVSSYDAVVTRVVAREGTPLVKNGEVVAKGTRLIAGELYNTAGEVMKNVRAEGEVYGIVNVKEQTVASLYSYEFVRTGRKFVTTDIGILGLTSKTKSPPFERYESVTYPYKFVGFLPLKLTRTEYYEIQPVETSATPTQRAEEFIAEAKLKHAFLGNGELNVKHIIKDLGGETVQITVYIEAEIIIGAL